MATRKKAETATPAKRRKADITIPQRNEIYSFNKDSLGAKLSKIYKNECVKRVCFDEENNGMLYVNIGELSGYDLSGPVGNVIATLQSLCTGEYFNVEIDFDTFEEYGIAYARYHIYGYRYETTEETEKREEIEKTLKNSEKANKQKEKEAAEAKERAELERLKAKYEKGDSDGT